MNVRLENGFADGQKKGTPAASALTKKVDVRRADSLIANPQSKGTAGRAPGLKFSAGHVSTGRLQAGHVRALFPSSRSANQEEAYVLGVS